MGMVGNLADFSLANMLQMFEKSSKSGKLSLQTENGTTRIWFYQGRVIAALSAEPNCNLRNLLKSHPEADDRLKVFLNSALYIDKPLGTYLKEQQLVSPQLLTQAFRQQIQIVIDNIIDNPTGEFRFVTNLPFPYLDMTGLSKGGLEIALQGLRQAETIQGSAFKLPKPESSLLKLTSELPLVSLSSLEWSIWEQIALEVTIKGIAHILGRELLEVSRACYRLIEIGLIEEVTSERRRELLEEAAIAETASFAPDGDKLASRTLLERLKNLLKSFS